jgi:hypothetical protein
VDGPNEPKCILRGVFSLMILNMKEERNREAIPSQVNGDK